MSATIEREFEELDAQNRWQQLYLVSPGLARQPPCSSVDPGSCPLTPSHLPRPAPRTEVAARAASGLRLRLQSWSLLKKRL
ncbi:hypothetical protein PAL_GLEAN10003848 [Pteropus alecto]|uniref:Uncharacterized protein n=1 Tax=Pteropus alecto TaxID=9402 RepID=L5KV27_PTEAL|nr:hypothetical protein PAL_GLEAN10003848 [Pteropus alecto]